MNSLVILSNILSSKPPGSGTIVAINNGIVSVRTTSGMVQATNSLSNTVKIGDEVRLNGETIVGRIVNQDNLPTYRV